MIQPMIKPLFLNFKPHKKAVKNAHSADVGIDIHFCKVDFAGIFLCDFVNDRSDHFARAAPFCPEINEDRFVGMEYVRFKRSVADGFDIVSHDVLGK